MTDKKGNAALPATNARTAPNPSGANTQVETRAPGAARDDILRAALRLFARDTFDGASVQEIAKAAGVGQPLVYYHFGSKDELWRAAVEFALLDLQKFYGVVAVTTVDLEPIDMLKVLCRAVIQFSSRCPEHAQIVLNEMRAESTRFEWLLDRYIRPIHQHLDALIAEATVRGQIKPIPPEYLVNAMLAPLVHFFTIAPQLKAIYGINAFDPEVIAAHSNYAMQMLFDGIKA